MRQSFSVTSPASTLSLISIERLRKAAGLEDGDTSQDAELTVMGAAISTDIAVACNVADDGLHSPTLLSETISETFWVCERADEVFLSRRFVSNVVSITEAGASLTTSDYFVDAGAGMLHRVSGGRPWSWCHGQVTVSYIAGLLTIPADLQEAAVDVARIRLSSASRDPLVKSESIEVPDIQTRRQDFWVGALPGSSVGPVPVDILSRLTRYMNVILT